MARAVQARGLTLVPTRIHFSGPRVKVEIALARGKKLHDKRETIKRREDERATRAATKAR
jgi:SsrA-binding protein